MVKSFLDGASKQNKQIVICVYDGCHVAFVLPVKCLTYYTCDGYSTLLTFNQYSRHSISTALLARVCHFYFELTKQAFKAFIYVDPQSHFDSHETVFTKRLQYCSALQTNVNVRFCHLKSRIP